MMSENNLLHFQLPAGHRTDTPEQLEAAKVIHLGKNIHSNTMGGTVVNLHGSRRELHGPTIEADPFYEAEPAPRSILEYFNNILSKQAIERPSKQQDTSPEMSRLCEEFLAAIDSIAENMPVDFYRRCRQGQLVDGTTITIPTLAQEVRTIQLSSASPDDPVLELSLYPATVDEESRVGARLHYSQRTFMKHTPGIAFEVDPAVLHELVIATTAVAQQLKPVSF